MAVTAALGISLTAIAAVFHVAPDGTKTIVLATDSLETIELNRGDQTHAKAWRRICKIGNAGRFYYAVAGLSANALGSYDAYKILATTLSTAASFAEQTATFEKQIVAALNGLPIPAPRSSSRIEVLVIDSEHFPQYYFGVVNRDAKGLWSMRPTSGVRSAAMTTDTFFVGIQIGKRAAEFQSRLPSEQPETLRQMLQREAIDRPQDVAEPFSILRITNGRAEWLERGACAER